MWHCHPKIASTCQGLRLLLLYQFQYCGDSSQPISGTHLLYIPGFSCLSLAQTLPLCVASLDVGLAACPASASGTSSLTSPQTSESRFQGAASDSVTHTYVLPSALCYITEWLIRGAPGRRSWGRTRGGLSHHVTLQNAHLAADCKAQSEGLRSALSAASDLSVQRPR